MTVGKVLEGYCCYFNHIIFPFCSGSIFTKRLMYESVGRKKSVTCINDANLLMSQVLYPNESDKRVLVHISEIIVN